MKNRRLTAALGCLTGASVVAAAMVGCSSSSSTANDSRSDVAPTITAKPQSAATSVDVTLTGSDTETCDLIFETANPVNGTLSEITDKPCEPGTPNTDSATVTFTAEPGVCGPGKGSFTYTTNDGSATSAPATVTVDIPCIEVDTGEP